MSNATDLDDYEAEELLKVLHPKVKEKVLQRLTKETLGKQLDIYDFSTNDLYEPIAWPAGVPKPTVNLDYSSLGVNISITTNNDTLYISGDIGDGSSRANLSWNAEDSFDSYKGLENSQLTNEQVTQIEEYAIRVYERATNAVASSWELVDLTPYITSYATKSLDTYNREKKNR